MLFVGNGGLELMELRLDRDYIIGIDIGGTKLAVVLSDRQGNIMEKTRRLTHAERGPDLIIEDIVDMAKHVMRQCSVSSGQVIGVGVACGGPLDSKAGVILGPPNLPGWMNVPLRDRLETLLGIPTVVENDANAGALAEYMFGAGRNVRNMVYMTMGTGIGGGIIADGRLISGANGNAGEVGHMVILPNGPLCACGRRGCLESLASGPAIARRVQEALTHYSEHLMIDMVNGDRSKLSAETLLEAVREKDELAIELLNETAYYMGLGIGNLVNVLNPELVVLGTIAVKAGDLLMTPIRRTVKEVAMSVPGSVVRVVPAQLGELVGDIGAIAIVLQRMVPEIAPERMPE